MTLRVWWVHEEECLFKTKGLNDQVIPVIRLDDLREVVEGLTQLKRLAEQNHDKPIDAVGDFMQIHKVVTGLIAQLKGVGDE